MRQLARVILKACGWTMAGEVPPFEKAVLIVAPHTSNWDGFWLLVYKLVLNVELRFFAKQTLFWWPLGWLLRTLGALPVDRRSKTSYVQQLVNAFATEDRLFLALAPEGTRKRLPYWKTGFYEIAMAANVPIVLGFIDYRKKEMGIGLTLPPTRVVEQDLEIIRDFYQSKEARRPENRSPIAFPPDYRAQVVVD